MLSTPAVQSRNAGVAGIATGRTGSIHHLGNATINDAANSKPMLSDQTFNFQSLKGKFDTDAYPSPYSDIVALMVFEHQMHMINLIIRLGWVVRLSQYQERTGSPLSSHLVTDGILRDGVHEVVDYMLFVDEASLPDKIQRTSGFAETFSAQGHRDSKERSLRQFDLQRRLMRFPCSYVIYSEAFDGMPDQARSASYKRMWQILSGEEKSHKYYALSLADRQAMVEILRETMKGLPDNFQSVWLDNDPNALPANLRTLPARDDPQSNRPNRRGQAALRASNSQRSGTFAHF